MPGLVMEEELVSLTDDFKKRLQIINNILIIPYPVTTPTAYLFSELLLNYLYYAYLFTTMSTYLLNFITILT